MLYTETVAGPTLELLKKLEAETAMADNGSHLKDFIDIAFHSTRFPFNSMLNGKYEWKLIEKRLIDMTKKQDKVFESFLLPRKKQTPEPIKKHGLKR